MQKKKKTKITKSCGNIFKDLDLPHAEKLMAVAEKEIEEQKLKKGGSTKEIDKIDLLRDFFNHLELSLEQQYLFWAMLQHHIETEEYMKGKTHFKKSCKWFDKMKSKSDLDTWSLSRY